MWTIWVTAGGIWINPGRWPKNYLCGQKFISISEAGFGKFLKSRFWYSTYIKREQLLQILNKLHFLEWISKVSDFCQHRSWRQNYFPKSCQWKSAPLPQCRDIRWIFHRAVCQKCICGYLSSFRFQGSWQDRSINPSSQNNFLNDLHVWMFNLNSIDLKQAHISKFCVHHLIVMQHS